MGDIQFGSLYLMEWTLDSDRNWRRYCINYRASPNAAVGLIHIDVSKWKPFFCHSLFFLNEIHVKTRGEYIIAKSSDDAKIQIDSFLQKMDSLKIFT